jgi:fructose-1,6-bisphosphatase/inositol monophosphatase family enzyme
MTMFTMSVGLRYKWKNVFWVIYNPSWDDLLVWGEWIWAYRNWKKLEKLTAKPLKKSMYYVDIPGIHKLSEEEKMIWLNFVNKVMLETYRVRMYGASVFAAFGCATGFLSWTLDVFGKQKDVDMCAYSAILQQVWYEEKKIKIWNKENIWLVLPENFEELKKLVK